LVRASDVGCPGLGVPAKHLFLKVGKVPRGDVHQDMDMFACAVGIALARPGGDEREAMLAGVDTELVSDAGGDVAEFRWFEFVERSYRDQDVERASDADCMFPSSSEFGDLPGD
jgi:hypothetical protein